MTERERLSGPDNAWLRLGERTNQMVITGVVVFDEAIEFDRLERKFDETLLSFDRFTQRIVYDALGRPKWEEDPEFALESHLHHVALPEPQDKETFEEFVAGQMATQLHPEMPLWQAYLVEGAGDGNALVMRIHHSIADGFALIYLLLGLADDPSEIDLPIGNLPDPPDVGEGDPPDIDDGGGSRDDARGLRERASGVVDAVKGGGRAAAMAGKAPLTLADLLTMDEEPDTSLVGELGVPKRVAWTQPIDLDVIEAIGEEYDGTINDVLMAVTAGGLRRYLQREEELELAEDLRVTVPVNLKPLDRRTADLGNYFGLVYLELPVGIASPRDRLQTVKSRMDDLKRSPQAFLIYALLLAGGNLPKPVQDLVERRFHDRATAVVTNVPGPTDSFTFAGEEVEDIFFWVPQSMGAGVGLSIFSYDGSVRIGVATDAGLVSDPEALVDALRAEVDAFESNVE
ncbi:wax ester/triacylglycerol synthase family O-acyltransferase [Halorarius halobius]|uniref:wax ester/triacylglycerol synthase family O-acyltransferase n=1 Tax=Halorarius halobius TaxID=2962671 RepID=UPI0020CBAB52|nr:wax ester/triacylglycerol synthase family O-acyltransferase [Halorarius halobius]